MKTEKNLWAGLNQPDMDIEEVDAVVFGVPFDGSVSFRNGANEGPDAIRDITYTIPPTTEYFENISDFKVKDLGNVSGASREEIFENTEKLVCELVEKNVFFTMIGGDHSVTIPVLRGIDQSVKESFGIIHIDAHFDLCESLGGDRLSHGSTERRALELDHVDSIDNLFFLGIRSIEEDEWDFMQGNDINVINAAKCSEMGIKKVIDAVKEKMARFNKIYITLDIDCLDPAYAAGTGTPQFGGLTSRELLTLLRGLYDLPIIGFDVVEVAPKLDPAMTSVFAARKIITECFGHIHRKTK